MDVERVQKINALALELMKQGLVPDREEAVIQAEKILSRKDYSSLSEAVEETKEVNPEGRKEEKEEKELSQEKIREIMEKNTAFFVRKFKELQEQLEKSKKEAEWLKNELRKVKEIFSCWQADKAAGKEEAGKEEPRKKLKESSEVEHPRSGSFKEDDVSIEKFFYSGSKPKG